MKQYEFAIRIAQIHHLLDERKYKKALAVVRTIDLKQVKSLSDLSVIADVFAKTEQFDSAKDAYLKIYNKSKTRRILHRLIYVSIRTKEIDEAEKYYQEFLEMNPSMRDIITTRYRIDKAAGVPIGKLIETLEELKEEEHIEEWSYELAKLYHKAGRFEECRRECEEIRLWFGHGEIVERAKELIDFIDDKETMPYLDDKDYTLDKGEPNPDDTGSLPDLDEYIQRKSRKNEKQPYMAASQEKKPDRYMTEPEQEMEWIESREPGNKQGKILNNDRNDENMHEQDDFIDDYDEDDFDIDAGLGKLARKLTGFFRFGSRKNNNNNNINRSEAAQDNYLKKDYNKKDSNNNSGQEDSVKGRYDIANNSKDDLDIKISINSELYNKTLENKKEAYREDILDRDNAEEFQGNEASNEEGTSQTNAGSIQQSPVVPVYSQSGMGITQDLSREISAIYEAEHGGQAKEKEVKPASGRRPLKRDATKVIERMTKAVKSDESKSIQPAGTDDTDADINELKHQKKPEEKMQETLQEENSLREEEAKAKEEEARLKEEEEAKAREEEARRLREEEAKAREEEARRLREEEEARAREEEARLKEEAQAKAREEEETRLREEAERKAREEETRLKEEIRLREEEAMAIVEEARRKAEEAERILAEAERKSAEVKAAILSNSKEKAATDKSVEDEEPEHGTDDIPMEEDSAKEKPDELENIWSEDKDKDSGWYEDGNCDDEFYDDAEYEDDENILDFDGKGLSDADLPTTRALHSSFDDILTLIGGEQDPSHFVFVGNNSNVIVGLSKRIVKVMKETGYMSTGRIAKISAKKLNQMDLSGFKNQLKGNCLLIHEAAELMVPTIASVFEIMDEFYGDFVVILADDGNTLDQLFKFAPALARRFKYIIDISGYTEEDCK